MANERADEDKFSNSEAALGGADSVQKTSYVTGGGGTDPDKQQDQPLIARVPSGGGANVGAWAVGVIALLIAVVYAAGIFR